MRKIVAFTASATLVIGILVGGGVATPKAAQAQNKTAGLAWPEMAKEIEGSYKPRIMGSFVMVERTKGKYLHVVPKISDPNKETDFLVQGEQIAWFTFNSAGTGSSLTADGVGYKPDGDAASFKWKKDVKNYKDNKGIMSSARENLFVAPYKLYRGASFYVYALKGESAHPVVDRIRILEKMPEAK